MDYNIIMDNSKYKKWYYRIIEKYSNVGDIFESHHIIPKSLGGTDDASNLVNVSPRVHFILHQLLYRMTKGEDKRKMYYAALMMGHTRKVKTGSHYQLLREQFPSIQSKRMKGNVPWNKGKEGCFSEETIEKFKKTRKGNVYSRKLTDTQIKEIRKLYEEKPEIEGVGDTMKNGRKMSYIQAFCKKYSSEYNITMQGMKKVVLEECWKNV